MDTIIAFVELRRSPQSVHLLQVHLVFVVKYRRRVLSREMVAILRDIFGAVCTALDAELIEFDGKADHVHLLVAHPPRLAVSDLVRRLKGVSSFELRKTYPKLKRRPSPRVLWSPTFFAASVGGAPISVLRRYIAQQATPP